MQKQERHQFIKELVAREKITRQSLIAERLANEGLSVTQASVSRDLEELGITKVNGAYKRVHQRSGGPELWIESLKPAGPNLLVARCAAGLASAITVRIDSAEIPWIIGTIAGDDTIFVAVPDAKAQAAAMKAIWELFGK